MTMTESPAAHLLGWDCIEFWVGNARTTAGFLMSAFGFRCTAYAGPETGVRDKASYVLEQGDIRFVVSRRARRRLADRRARAHATATGCTTSPGSSTTPTPRSTPPSARGARRVREPWIETRRPRRRCDSRQVAAYGETVHTFVDRSALPRRRCSSPATTTDNLPNPTVGPPVGLHAHRPRRRQRRAGPARRLGAASTRDVLGFASCSTSTTTRSAPSTRRSMSTVVWDGSKIVMPINEPADGLQEEPDPGVHRALRRAGRAAHRAAHRRHRRRRCRRCATAACGSCRCPTTYYDEARERLAGVDLPWDELQRLEHPRRPRPRRATCCRSSPRRSPTGRRCSSRSSSARARRASARATSRRCSRRSSATRQRRGNL